MAAKSRYRAMWVSLALAITVLVASACSETKVNRDDDAAFDSYARGVCLAIGTFTDTLRPQMTPGAGPPRDAMITAWETFIRDLGKANPPASLEDYHKAWLAMQREDLDAFRSGQPTYYDPLDHAPDLSADLQRRTSEAFARVPECKFEGSSQPTAVPPAAPTATPVPPPTAAEAIDYANPRKYVQAGNQSKLSDANNATVRAEVPKAADQLHQAGVVAEWLRTAFRVVPAGGATIGSTDVNTLIQTRVLTGCHDSALVLSTVLRAFDIPALMVDTASIQWAEDFNAGKAAGDTGHVFVEAHLDGRWTVIECGSGSYATDYDPSNPVITAPSMPDKKGYYVLAKGVDPAGYGVTSGSLLHERFVAFAEALPSLQLRPPSYQWQTLPR